MTETLRASDFVPQHEIETASLLARDIRTEDALFSYAFQESAEITASYKTCTLNPTAAARSPWGERLEQQITLVPPEILKAQDETQVFELKEQAIQSIKERDPDGFPADLKIDVALTTQRNVKGTIRGSHRS